MTREEIQTYVQFGRTKTLRVDSSIVQAYPSFVREVRIRRDYGVEIEFLPYGHDEGGLLFQTSFQTLDELVANLESYLEKPISTWVNFNQSGEYPERQENISDQNLSWHDLEMLFRKLVPKEFVLKI